MMHTKGEVTLLKCEKCRSLFATADGHMSHVCLSRRKYLRGYMRSYWPNLSERRVNRLNEIEQRNYGP